MNLLSCRGLASNDGVRVIIRGAGESQTGIHSTFLLVLTLLAGCVGGSSGPADVNSAASCFPLDVQSGESASYTIATASQEAPVLLRVTITSASSTGVAMQIEDDGRVSNVFYDTQCEAGRNQDLVIPSDATPVLGLSSAKSQSGGTSSDVSAPQLVVANACRPDTVVTPAGTFDVDHCSTDYGRDGPNRRVETYAINSFSGAQRTARPLAFGIVKQVETYYDNLNGGSRTIELVQWNGL